MGEDGPAGRLPNWRTAQGTREDYVQNSMGVTGTGKEASWGPSWKCRQIWRGQATGLACSCWLALHVSLVAGKAAPASRPAPVSPFLCCPTCTTGKPRATPYSFCPIMALAGHSTSPAVSDPSSQPLISTFLTIFHPVSLRPIFSALLTGRSSRRPAAASHLARQQACWPTSPTTCYHQIYSLHAEFTSIILLGQAEIQAAENSALRLLDV